MTVGSRRWRSLVLVMSSLATLLGISQPGQAASSSFNFSDFVSSTGLTLVGDATQEQNYIRLTTGVTGSTGALWWGDRFTLSAGFDTTFRYSLKCVFGCGDGLAFVIQNASPTALGGGGGGQGYWGMEKSIAVEFDYWDNSEFPDPPAPHTSVQTRGIEPNSPDHTFSLGTAGYSCTLPCNVRVAYVTAENAPCAPGTLSVYVDDLQIPKVSASLNICDLINISEGRAWIGFTAGNGTRRAQFKILSWSANGSDCSSLDGDSDGLTGCQEAQQGTTDNDKDFDDDGMSDFSESTWKGNRAAIFCGLDERCEYPDPIVPDVYVEVDYMSMPIFPVSSHSHRIADSMVARIQQTFQRHGVNLHIDQGHLGGGEEIDHDDYFSDSNWDHSYEHSFSALRRGIFHYAVMAHRDDTEDDRGYLRLEGFQPKYKLPECSKGGRGVADGDRVVIFRDCAGESTNLENAIVHELGHNLFGVIEPPGQNYCVLDPSSGRCDTHDIYPDKAMWFKPNGATDYHDNRWSEWFDQNRRRG